MKRTPFKKLKPTDQAAILELANINPNALLKVSKSQKKGVSDLPLFALRDTQTDLFK